MDNRCCVTFIFFICNYILVLYFTYCLDNLPPPVVPRLKETGMGTVYEKDFSEYMYFWFGLARLLFGSLKILAKETSWETRVVHLPW